MNTLIRILALSAVIALSGCADKHPRPELLSDWSDELLEDEIMDYYDSIAILQEEQKRRVSPEKVY
jgi:hypothetical protein